MDPAMVMFLEFWVLLTGLAAVALLILRTGGRLLTVSSRLVLDLTAVMAEASSVMSEIVSSVLVGVEQAFAPFPLFFGVAPRPWALSPTLLLVSDISLDMLNHHKLALHIFRHM